ncbi:MAG: MFS transporter [Actinocatenispora sp.]
MTLDAQAAVPAEGKAKPKAPSLWRNRDFNLLWVSQCFSALGSGITGLAYPLAVLVLTHSAVAAGAVGTVAMVVRTVLRLPAGVLVDRVNRRRLMLACDAIRLTIFVLLGVAMLTSYASLPLILAVAVVESVCSVGFEGAEMSAVRNLVPMDQVSTAVARNEARSAGVSLVGPPLGGALFSLGRAVPFLADALSYLFSLGGLLLIRRPFQEADRKAPTTSPLHDLVEGLRFVVGEPFLRASMLIAPAINFALNGMIFGLILLLQRNGTPPVLIGTIETAVGVGAMVGAVLAGQLLRRLSTATLVRVICVIGVPLLLAVLPFANSPLAGAPLTLVMLVAPALNAGLFGYLAAVTPDRLQGRVTSALMTAAMSLAALAPLVAGLLVNHFGAVGVVLGFTAAYAVGACFALFSKGIRTMRPVGEQSAVEGEA